MLKSFKRALMWYVTNSGGRQPSSPPPPPTPTPENKPQPVAQAGIRNLFGIPHGEFSYFLWLYLDKTWQAFFNLSLLLRSQVINSLEIKKKGLKLSSTQDIPMGIIVKF